MNGTTIGLFFIGVLCIFMIAIFVAVGVDIINQVKYEKENVIKVQDLIDFDEEVNWIMNYQGTLDFEDLTFMQCMQCVIREDNMNSENNYRFKIVHDKSASVTISTKFVTLTIYDNMNREERCFRIKLSDSPSEQAIHIKTDHDYVEDLICIRDIIHRVDKVYDKYIKIVV